MTIPASDPNEQMTLQAFTRDKCKNTSHKNIPLPDPTDNNGKETDLMRKTHFVLAAFTLACMIAMRGSVPSLSH